jgi:hypothetical protein
MIAVSVCGGIKGRWGSGARKKSRWWVEVEFVLNLCGTLILPYPLFYG